MPSKSLYWHTFGSLANALREAGFDVPVGEEKLERALEQGDRARADARPAAEVRRLVGRAPRGRVAADRVADLPHVRGPRGAWSTFQFLVRERLVASRDGRSPRRSLGRVALERRCRAPRAAGGRTRPRAAPARPGAARSSKFRSGGSARARPLRRRVDDRRACPSASSRLRSFSRRYRSTTSSAALVEAKKQLVAAVADPERAADAAGEEERRRARARRARRSPSSRAAAPERAGAPLVRLGEREDRLRVDGHLAARRARSRAASISSSSLKMIPLWTPTTAPCRIGWLLASIRGWPFV